jgi:CheY-like chemotaxis protein
MNLPDRVYRRNLAGQKGLAGPERTQPPEYRRILALIEQDTHSDVVRGYLRQFPDALLADWLAEMEEIGYLSSVPADSTQSLDFTELFNAARPAAAPLAAEDRKRVERQATQAAAALGDGFDILAALRRHPKLALLPVVMLTAVTGKENVRRGLELGADGYITKPYSKKIVVETIRGVLRHA